MTRPVAQYGKVAVLMGGWSAERGISLQSGSAVLTALQAAGVNAHGVDVDRDVLRTINDEGYDHAFIVLHGRGGEDGVIQGVLEASGIPYTGSGVLGTAVSMDKLMTKQIWRGAGLPTPDFQILAEFPQITQVVSTLGLPCIVKPTLEGSSLGMTKVEHETQLGGAWDEASRFECPVMTEAWVEGEEYTVAILGDAALPVLRLETPRAFYDFDAKYKANDTRYHCPCGLSPERERGLQELALKAFKLTAASGWGRVDVMVDEHDKSWLIEVNTVPGMTDHSLVPMAAAAAGIDFEQLVLCILDTAIVGAAV